MQRIVARYVRTGVAGAICFTASLAHSAPQDVTDRQEAIYVEARAAFDKGDFDKACPLFRDYYELMPVPAALFTLAECEARWGKPARAIEHFEAFLRRGTDAPPSPVQEQRTRMAYEQIARLSLLVGKVTPSVATSVAGSVSVKLDGVPLTMPAAHPIVIEPGEHVLEMTSEAGTREQRRFVVGAGEVRKIELGAPAVVEQPAAPRQDATPPTSSRTLTAPVVVAGGIGAVGLVVGTVFGLLALGTKSDIDAHCRGLVCDSEGKSAADEGQSLALVGTVGFVVGALGAAAAATLYFTQPSRSGSPSASAVRVRFSPGGMAGTF